MAPDEFGTNMFFRRKKLDWAHSLHGSCALHQKLLLYDFVYAVKIVLKTHISDRNYHCRNVSKVSTLVLPSIWSLINNGTFRKTLEIDDYPSLVLRVYYYCLLKVSDRSKTNFFNFSEISK
jgi:hypothetical protein